MMPPALIDSRSRGQARNQDSKLGVAQMDLVNLKSGGGGGVGGGGGGGGGVKSGCVDFNGGVDVGANIVNIFQIFQLRSSSNTFVIKIQFYLSPLIQKILYSKILFEKHLGGRGATGFAPL